MSLGLSYITLERTLSTFRTYENMKQVKDALESISKLVEGSERLDYNLYEVELLSREISDNIPSVLRNLFRDLVTLLDVKDVNLPQYSSAIINPRIDELTNLIDSIRQYNARIFNFFKILERLDPKKLSKEDDKYIKLAKGLIDLVSVEISAIGVAILIVKSVFTILVMKQENKTDMEIEKRWGKQLIEIQNLCIEAEVKSEKIFIVRIQDDLKELDRKVSGGLISTTRLQEMVHGLIRQIFEFAEYSGFRLDWSTDDLLSIQRLNLSRATTEETPITLASFHQLSTDELIKYLDSFAKLSEKDKRVIEANEFTGLSFSETTDFELAQIGLPLGKVKDIRRKIKNLF